MQAAECRIDIGIVCGLMIVHSFQILEFRCSVFSASCRGRQVAVDVAEGLHFLHSEMRVMHSDLKAA